MAAALRRWCRKRAPAGRRDGSSQIPSLRPPAGFVREALLRKPGEATTWTLPHQAPEDRSSVNATSDP